MDAIILARRDARETDQTIVFLSREAGKINALARGVKKATSKLSPHLEPFAVTNISLAAGRDRLHVIAAERREAFPRLAAFFPRRLAALAAAGIADRLLPEGEADSRPFFVLRNLFAALDKGEAENEAFWRFFLQMFSAVGLSPALDACALCRRSGAAWFSASAGGVVCGECASTASDALPCDDKAVGLLRALAHHGYSPATAFAESAEETKKAARDMLDRLARHQAGFALPSLGYPLPKMERTMSEATNIPTAM